MRSDADVVWALRKWLPREPQDPWTGYMLAEWIYHQTGRRPHVRRIGEAVRALREEGWLIDSNARGYVVVTDPARIAKWMAREERRAKAILYTIGARKRLEREEVDRRMQQTELFG